MNSVYGNVVQRVSNSSGFSSQECHIEADDEPPESNTKQNPILETLKNQNNPTLWNDKNNNINNNIIKNIECDKEKTLLNGNIIQTVQKRKSSGSDSSLSDSEVIQRINVVVASPTPTPSSPSTSSDTTPNSLSPAPPSPNFSASFDNNNNNEKSDLFGKDDNGNIDAKSTVSSPSYHPSLPGEKMPLLGKSLSWVNPKLEARVTKTGCGLFCASPVMKHEYLIVWTGKILSAAEALAIMETHEKHYILQIGDGFYQTPLQEEREPADLTNHSCEPTAGFGANSPICLTALRNMDIGEEVVFDYGMCETDERLWEPMDCACGSKYCRGLITAHDWKREDLWERYEGCWAPHVQKKN